MKPTIMVPIERFLAKSETLQVRTGPHWIVFLRSICVAAALAVLGCGIAAEAFRPGSIRHALGALACLDFAIVAAIIVSITVRRRAQAVLVTDRRIVAFSGIMKRTSTETWLSSVQSISLDQSIFGRLLNFGTVTLFTANQEPMVLKDISFPLELHQALQDHRTVQKEFSGREEDYAAGA